MARGTERIGLGLAAIGRPVYITTGRRADLGSAEHRSIPTMRERAHRLLDAAWDAGVRHVDVARSYGLAEEFLGSWLAQHPERRRAILIGSKWGYEYVGGWRSDAEVHERKEHSLPMFERQWQETNAALGTAPDLYLIHSVTPESPALDDAPLLDALRALAASGVRVGISTSGPSQAAVIDRARMLPHSPFSTVQATWNLLERSAEAALLRASAEGWLVVVKEAIANGRLLDPAVAPGVAALARRDRTTMDAVALGAALGRPWADRVLSGAVTADQLRQNLAAVPLETAPESQAAEDPAHYWATRAELAWS